MKRYELDDRAEQVEKEEDSDSTEDSDAVFLDDEADTQIQRVLHAISTKDEEIYDTSKIYFKGMHRQRERC